MSLEISVGRFDDTIIKIKQNTEKLLEPDLTMIDEIEHTKQSGALWFFIHESDISKHLDFVKNRGYMFHHYESQWFVYGKWNNPNVDDKIQPYATSITGSAILVFSPDMKEIFLVFEYGKYKCVTGATDYRELIMNTGIRELKEETGFETSDLDLVMCGGWNISNVKPSMGVNDVLFCYAAKITDKSTLKLDKTELQGGKWFDVEFLSEAYKYMIDNPGILDNFQKSNTLYKASIEYQGEILSCAALVWLNNYRNGRVMNSHTRSDNMILF